MRRARAYTGRDLVVCCADHPFFSVDDWFIGTTPMNASIPGRVRQLTRTFRYNDLASAAAYVAGILGIGFRVSRGITGFRDYMLAGEGMTAPVLVWAAHTIARTDPDAVMGSFAADHVVSDPDTFRDRVRLAADVGPPMAVCSCTSVLAWLAAVRGDEDRCRELANHAVELSETHHLAAIAVVAIWALGLLELSLGRAEEAIDRLLEPEHGPLANPTPRL